MVVGTLLSPAQTVASSREDSEQVARLRVDCMWCRLVDYLVRYGSSACTLVYRRLPSRSFYDKHFGGIGMRELTKEQLNNILHSDMKLWETAATEQKGNTITKSLLLPHGIGEMRVEFTGVDNGLKRRSAVEQWGLMVRDQVKNAIADESVTARAQQAAAIRASEAEYEGVERSDSGHGTEDQPVELRDNTAVQEKASAGSVQAHAQSAQEDTRPEGTDFTARAEWLRERIGEGERQLRGWRRELKALEAALAVLGEDE